MAVAPIAVIVVTALIALTEPSRRAPPEIEPPEIELPEIELPEIELPRIGGEGPAREGIDWRATPAPITETKWEGAALGELRSAPML